MEIKTDKNHTISLIIPSYNYGEFLTEAIESGLNQTLVPDEIIILDDCSHDNTEEVGRYYQAKYPDLIKYHKNDYNMGIVDNFNNGIKMTKGEFICFLGADNRFNEQYIQKTSEILKENDQVAIAYTDFVLFGERAKSVYEGFLEDRKGEIIDNKYYIIRFPEFDKDLLETGNYIHGSSMYRRSAFNEVGGYQNKGTTPEDYNLFYRMVLAGWKAKRVPEPLLEYRQHSENQANIKNIAIAETEFYKAQNKELYKVIESRDNDIEVLKREVVFRDKEIDTLKSIVLHRDRDIIDFEKLIQHRDRDIAELQDTVRLRQKDVLELQSALKLREKEIVELQKVISHRDQDIVLLNEVIFNKKRKKK